MAELFSEDAERIMLANALADRRVIGAAMTSHDLQPDDFYFPAYRYLWQTLVEAYVTDDPTDAMTLGSLTSVMLSKIWHCPEVEAATRVRDLPTTLSPSPRSAEVHSLIVRRKSDLRSIAALLQGANEGMRGDDPDPTVLASELAKDAAQIAMGTHRTEVEPFGDLGRDFVSELRLLRAARAAGIMVGVQTGLTAVDAWTNGIKPGELMILAGGAGVGKSALAWKLGLNFAEAQGKRPEGKQVATLVANLEMSRMQGASRWAQALTAIEGRKLRDGSLDDEDMKRIVKNWGERKDIPLFVASPTNPKASQVRATVSESVRKHNVGFVIIDHFREFRMDSRMPGMNVNEVDEEKVSFLVNDIAKEFNVAVVCLAHTRKVDDPSGKPRMADLRGSGQMAAVAHMVTFLYRPSQFASEQDILSGRVSETEAHLIWEKNRNGPTGTSTFFFDPERMVVV
jgi:replicative DNA helicase